MFCERDQPGQTEARPRQDSTARQCYPAAVWRFERATKLFAANFASRLRQPKYKTLEASRRELRGLVAPDDRLRQNLCCPASRTRVSINAFHASRSTVSSRKCRGQ